jgi:hypothetical protein
MLHALPAVLGPERVADLAALEAGRIELVSGF